MNLSPRSRMSATITLSKPFGIPDSSNTLATSVPPVMGVSSCGFSTTPLPAPMAVRHGAHAQEKRKIERADYAYYAYGTR